MNLPRIIVLGMIGVIIIVLIASILVSRFVLQDRNDTPQPMAADVTESPEESPIPTEQAEDVQGIGTQQESAPVSQDATIVGVPVALTETEVQRVISSNVFWVGPPGTDTRSILVVYPQEIGLRPNQKIRVNGVIGRISEVDRSGWNLTADEESVLRDEGVYLRATSVNTL